jgi:GST-like protein
VATEPGPSPGQCVHFKHFTPEPGASAVNCDAVEAWRPWCIVDAQLAQHRCWLGDSYGLIDTAVWRGARAVPFILDAVDDEAGEPMFPQKARLAARVGLRRTA